MFSREFYNLFMLSDLVVSSQLYDLEYMGKTLVNSRYVYLQHGIQLNDMSDWVISKLFDLFVVTGEPEKQYMQKLAPRETLNSGIPRLQTLQRSNGEGSGDLLFMPTWRFGLHTVDESTFLKSSYFRAIDSVLTDRQLLEYLSKSGRRLQVKLHPNLKKRLKCFSFSEHVIHSDSSYRDAISHSAFAFTDYSSVLADAAFIDVPVAYYQWDAETFFRDQPYENRLDYVAEGMGPVFHEHESLITYITSERFLADDAMYAARREWFFEGIERESICERIVERMLAL